MVQKKILVPTKNVESWKELLADREKHWRKEYSAMETALSWENKGDIPKEILNSLKLISDFEEVELLIAIPEYKVSLPGGTRPSQNDVFALLSTTKQLAVMTVEGKAKEDFDDTIRNWKRRTSEAGVKERLGFILKSIGIVDKDVDSLRYQLLHRMASAVIMASKFHAKSAIMLIQSFNNDDTKNHFSDFKDFLELYSITNVDKSKIYYLTDVNGVDLYAGWVFSK